MKNSSHNMRALTLWPEWAWAVTRLLKNVENRKVRTSLEIGSDLAIHAGVALGGSTKKYVRIDDAFAPVETMARRANWRIGANLASHTVQGYRTDCPSTFSDCVADIPQGAVVAVARFSGLLVPGIVVDPGKWPWWAEDQFGYILNDVRVLKEPVKCRGQQGMWNLKGTILEKVLKQIGSF